MGTRTNIIMTAVTVCGGYLAMASNPSPSKAQVNQSPTTRAAFAAQYRLSGPMMGSACNKVVLYGREDNSFALKCPGINRATARLILADRNSPIARELRAHGFQYFSITPADGNLPEVKL